MSDEKKESWEMPKPVFKSSEGSLPRSLEETISHSFMANADTLEIDEDDDILGIMDTLPNMPLQKGDADDEIILETGPAEESISTPEADAPTNQSSTDSESTKPISVTAKEPTEHAEAKAGNSSMFVMIALLAAIVVVLIYYFSTNK